MKQVKVRARWPHSELRATTIREAIIEALEAHKSGRRYTTYLRGDWLLGYIEGHYAARQWASASIKAAICQMMRPQVFELHNPGPDARLHTKRTYTVIGMSRSKLKVA